jgi:hypothetical protein
VLYREERREVEIRINVQIQREKADEVHNLLGIIILTIIACQVKSYKSTIILPIAQLDDLFRYGTNIAAFLVVSKSFVDSR